MGKHLTLDDRAFIQQKLAAHISLRQIAGELNRSLSVVSREIRKHRKACDDTPRYRVKNKCINRKNCSKCGLCPDLPDCTKRCATCSKCNALCPDFVEEHCPRIDLPPYVCNGCEDKHTCVLSKLLYTASTAQTDYDKLLRSARTGLNMTEDELDSLDALVSPLLRNGQSINHVAMTQCDNLIRAPRTLYRLVHASLISARPIDMPRMCRLKPRRSGSALHKVDQACRVGRTLCDFHDFIAKTPDLPIVEMDSVISSVGGKVLLTLHLTSFDSLTQQDVSLMMSHINSYARGKFAWLSPAQLLVQAYGEETLLLLGQTLIPSKKIVLNGSIFRK